MEVQRAAAEISVRLERDGLAVVATPAGRPASIEAGERVATHLANVVRAIDPPPGAVLAKGGITAAVTAHLGLGARSALVRGPLVDGVALWEAGGMPYVVFPGNVGSDGTLLEVVRMILRC